MHDSTHIQIMPIEQLKEMGANLGVRRTRGETEASLRQRVTVALDNMSPKQIKQEPRVIKIEESTKEQILEAIEQYKGKGFEVKFDEDSWQFCCKGAEDSGTMKQSIRVIERKAQQVAMGARNPRGAIVNGQVVLSA